MWCVYRVSVALNPFGRLNHRLPTMDNGSMPQATLQNGPFVGPGTTPTQAIWVDFPADSITGITGPVLFFSMQPTMSFSDLRFGQRCEQQLFLFGDIVYSGWRVWRLSPRDLWDGNISLVPSGRYWWPQMQWSGNYEDLPADTILNMEHKHMTPEAYNANDPNFNTQPDATRWTG